MLNVERHADSVVVWTVDRPLAKNALDHATMEVFIKAAREAATDPTLTTAIITGANDAFVSGGDLRALRGRHETTDAELLTDLGHELTSAVAELPFPVIAALTGPAIGGGAELAMACDMRIAERRARIAFKQVRMGVTTAWGTIPRLVAAIGSSRAARLLYTAEELSAEDAKILGLVDEVTDDGQAKATAMTWASEIALGSPRAIARMKQLVREATHNAHAAEIRALEREVFVETWTSRDHVDAVEAFFERRPPRWDPR